MMKDGTVVKNAQPFAQQSAGISCPDAFIAVSGYGTRNQYGKALQVTACVTPDNVVKLYNSGPN